MSSKVCKVGHEYTPGEGCPTCKTVRRKDYNSAWHKANPKDRQQYKDYRRAWRYGLSPEQYQSMVDAQKGICCLCEVRPIQVIDHCHKTGKARGLLCRQCNAGIGLLSDSQELLEKAAKYVTLRN